MSTDGYRDGIRTETDFLENGFGIDPHGCGCTDCLTGQAFPISDMVRIKAAVNQGRTLYNRTGHEVFLPNGLRLDDEQTWRPAASRDLVGEARALTHRNPGYTSRGPAWELRRARNLLTELADEIESLRTERDQHAETARQALATATHQAGQLSAIRSAREITDPAELPTGSIVVRDGVAWQLEKGWWSMRGTRTRWDKPHGTGPIILLYVPTEEAEPVVGATLQCGQCGATATAPASPDGRTVPIAPLTGWQLIPDQHVVRCPGCVPAEEATGE